jgi:plastocyanin
VIRRALVLAGLLLIASPASGATRQPVAIGVAQREYHITAYRTTVTPGRVRLNVQNFGQDTHNLVVRGPHHYRLQGPDIRSGEHVTINARLLRPGTYMLLCTRANHQALGMWTRIHVRR